MFTYIYISLKNICLLDIYVHNLSLYINKPDEYISAEHIFANCFVAHTYGTAYVPGALGKPPGLQGGGGDPRGWPTASRDARSYSDAYYMSCIYIYICMYVHVYMYDMNPYIYIHVFEKMYIYTYMYIHHRYVQIYRYIYIYVYIYLYVYI